MWTWEGFGLKFFCWLIKWVDNAISRLIWCFKCQASRGRCAMTKTRFVLRVAVKMLGNSPIDGLEDDADVHGTYRPHDLFASGW